MAQFADVILPLPLDGTFTYNLPKSFPFVLLYTAIIMGALLLMHKVRFLRWLTNPLAKHKTTAEEKQ